MYSRKLPECTTEAATVRIAATLARLPAATHGFLIDIRVRKGQRFQMDAIVDSEMLLTSIDVQMIEVDGQQLQVAVKRGPKRRPPLLMFNGIGANWQLAKPFLTALKQTEAIIFDIPGVGGSPLPAFPYRPSTIARLAMGLVERLGHEQVDVAGVSWGGTLAQQFARFRREGCGLGARHVAGVGAPHVIVIRPTRTRPQKAEAAAIGVDCEQTIGAVHITGNDDLSAVCRPGAGRQKTIEARQPCKLEQTGSVGPNLEHIGALEEGDPFAVRRPCRPDIPRLRAGDDRSRGSVGGQQSDTAARLGIVERDPAIDPINSRGIIVTIHARESELTGTVPANVVNGADHVIDQPRRIRAPAIANDEIGVGHQKILVARD